MWYVYIFEFILLVGAPLVKSLLKVIGIGAVSYVGINLILDQATQYIITNAGNIGQAVQMLLGMASFDVAINIYLSAITTKLVFKGMDKVTGKLTELRRTGSGSLEA